MLEENPTPFELGWGLDVDELVPVLRALDRNHLEVLARIGKGEGLFRFRTQTGWRYDFGPDDAVDDGVAAKLLSFGLIEFYSPSLSWIVAPARLTRRGRAVIGH